MDQASIIVYLSIIFARQITYNFTRCYLSSNEATIFYATKWKQELIHPEDKMSKVTVFLLFALILVAYASDEITIDSIKDKASLSGE